MLAFGLQLQARYDLAFDTMLLGSQVRQQHWVMLFCLLAELAFCVRSYRYHTIV
jgi:hypothetical protein